MPQAAASERASSRGKNGETASERDTQRLARRAAGTAGHRRQMAPGAGVGAQRVRSSRNSARWQIPPPHARNPCGGTARCRDKDGPRRWPDPAPRRTPCGWPGCSPPAPRPSGRQSSLARARRNRARADWQDQLCSEASSVTMAPARSPASRRAPPQSASAVGILRTRSERLQESRVPRPARSASS